MNQLPHAAPLKTGSASRRPRLGPLHGEHRQIRALRDLERKVTRLGADPGEILRARAGVDDEAKMRGIEEVGDEIIHHAAGRVQHAAVEGRTRARELGDVVGEQVTQKLARARAGQIDDAHVRDVKYAGDAAHRVMLLDLRGVLHRHVPAAEIHQPRAEAAVQLIKRCTSSHRSLR